MANRLRILNKHCRTTLCTIEFITANSYCPYRASIQPKPMAKKRAAKKNAVKRQKKVKVLSRKKVSKKAVQPVGAKKNMPKRSMFL